MYKIKQETYKPATTWRSSKSTWSLFDGDEKLAIFDSLWEARDHLDWLTKDADVKLQQERAQFHEYQNGFYRGVNALKYQGKIEALS